MTTTFTRLPVIAINNTLPKILRADTDYLTNFDPSTYEHWLLGESAACLTGPVNGNVLTPQAGVTFSQNFATLSSPIGSGLLTNLSESAALVRTMCCVFRFSTTAAGLYGIMGSLGTFEEYNGGSLFISGTSPNQSVFSTYRGITSSVNLGTITNNMWYFAATSVNFAGTTKQIKHLIGGFPGYEFATAAAYLPPTAGRKTALGCAYGPPPTASVNPMDVAEFMVFDDQALSMADLQAVYASRKAKLAARGIVVV